jgi:hypothetical protein
VRTFGVLIVVAAVAASIALPIALTWIRLPNDVVEYVAVARNWVEGRGFVDPILYSYYLGDTTPPVAAIVVRAPVISVLFAFVLWLGGGLAELSVAHVAWASCIGASTVLLGQRVMSLPAAAALGIVVAWSPAWELASTRLLTEATAIGVLLLLIALAPYGLRSARGALILSSLTLLGWLTRPNLAASCRFS